MKIIPLLSINRNGMYNGDKHYNSAEDMMVCRCKRWGHTATKHHIIINLRCITHAMTDPDEPLNSVSKIDRISRSAFIWCLISRLDKIIVPELCFPWATSSSTSSTGTTTWAAPSWWTRPWRATTPCNQPPPSLLTHETTCQWRLNRRGVTEYLL